MALTSVGLQASLRWKQFRAGSTGYGDLTQGDDSKGFNLNGVSTTTFNQLYTASFTLAAAASTTVDLQNVVTLVYETIAFTKVLSLMVLPVGSECTLSPGAADPLTWFLTGTTPAVVIPAGGLFMFSLPSTSTGQTVDATHKTLKLLNSGATSLTVSITVIGSTI